MNFFKTLKIPKKAMKIIIISFIVIVVGGGGYYGYTAFFGKKPQAQQRTAKVDRGTVETTISGSGQIEPNDRYEITSLAKGEIIAASFIEGDYIEKGQLLYKIDPKDVQNSIDRSSLDLEKSKSTYAQTADNINKLIVKSAYSGTISELTVKEGDNINANQKIATVIENSNMLLRIPFITDDAKQLRVGNDANVILESSSHSVWGKVASITSGSTVSSLGVEVTTVEITVPNPGSIKSGDKATALVNGVACNDLGTFEFNKTGVVTAEVAGKITSLPYKEGDKINKGDIIAKCSSESLSTTQTQNSLSIRTSELSLKGSYDQLDNYTITSPIAGTVIQKTTKLGDTLDNSTTRVVMAIIADMSKILFKMNVDELDIAKIEIDQKVTITADALPGKTFEGHIDYKGIVGTSSNGVTSYPVTVVVDNPDGLIPGMNVNAKVIVERKENVLRIPVSALNRGGIVFVKLKDGEKAPDPAAAMSGRQGGPNGQNQQAQSGQGEGQQGTQRQSGQQGDGATRQYGGGQGGQRAASGGQASGQAGQTSDQTGQTAQTAPSASPGAQAPQGMRANVPDGFRMAFVRSGLNDKDYVEITDGLSEGDEVYIPTQQATATTTTTTTPGMGGGMGAGGMGGGQPQIRVNGASGGTSGGAAR